MDILVNKNLDIQIDNKYDNIKKDISNYDQERLKQVCNDFEAFFMQKIYEVSLKNSTIAGEGTGSSIIKSMYTQSLAQKSSGTLGISDMLFSFLSQNNGKK